MVLSRVCGKPSSGTSQKTRSDPFEAEQTLCNTSIGTERKDRQAMPPKTPSQLSYGRRHREHNCKKGCVLCSVAQSCPALYDPVDCVAPPGSSAHGILQARIPEWFAMPSSGGIFPTQGSVEPRSPALQVDSLPSEPHGTPIWSEIFPAGPRISAPVCLPPFPQLLKRTHVGTSRPWC